MLFKKKKPDMILVDRKRWEALLELEKRLIRWIEKNKAKGEWEK